MPTCILCSEALSQSSHDLLWLHPESDQCLVRITDSHGVSVDARFEVDADGTIWDTHPAPSVTPRQEIVAAFKQFGGNLFTSFDTAVNDLFDAHGLPRLGGASGDSGWSAYSTLQKCPYLYKRKYIDKRPDPYAPAESDDTKNSAPALEIGSMVHLYLACFYQLQIDDKYPLTANLCHEYFCERGVNPESTEMAKKVYDGYLVEYADEPLRPLAVEYLNVDPHTKSSCRYDLIVEVTEHTTNYPKGVYNMDHKIMSKADYATMNGWFNNGEIIGQMMLYQKNRLDLRFGPLAGSLINLGFKTKVPKFHRVYVPVKEWQLEAHAKDLAYWSAQRSTYRSLGVWPRARNSCQAVYGLCSEFDWCSSDSNPDNA